MEKSSLQKLTELQNKVGYVKGALNTVAVLGLAGEIGELLDPLKVAEGLNEGETNDATGSYCAFIKHSLELEAIKKLVRSKKKSLFIILEEKHEDAFDKEMVDVLYYLNALAINRGKTLDEYAEMSYQKVLKRSQIDISHGKINSETLLINPYNCFGRRPHVMDFDDTDEFTERVAKWENWENEHRKSNDDKS